MFGKNKEIRELLRTTWPIIILGSTGAGKTVTACTIAEEAHRMGRDFIFVTPHPGLKSDLIPVVKGRVSYSMIREHLDSICNKLVASQMTTGVGAGYAGFELKTKCNNIQEFMKALDYHARERGSPLSWGSQAIIRRFKPLIDCGFITDERVDVSLPVIFDLSWLVPYTRDLALELTLTFMYTLITVRSLRDLVLIVDEAELLSKSKEEPISLSLLEEVRKFDVIPVLVHHNYDPKFFEANLIVHDLGTESVNAIRRYAFPNELKKLGVGEAVVYNRKTGKWRKIKVKPSSLIRVVPVKPETPSVEESEKTEEQPKVEVKTPVEEVGSEETPIEEVKEEISEPVELPIEKQKEQIEEEGESKPEVKEQREPEASRSSELMRVLEEHKILVKEWQRFKDAVSADKIQEIIRKLENVDERVNRTIDEKINKVYKSLEVRNQVLASRLTEVEQKMESPSEDKDELTDEITEKIRGEIKGYVESLLEKNLVNLEEVINRAVDKKLESLIAVRKQIETPPPERSFKTAEQMLREKEEVDLPSLFEKGVLKYTVKTATLEVVEPTRYLGDLWSFVVSKMKERGFMVNKKYIGYDNNRKRKLYKWEFIKKNGKKESEENE